jgi:hypothetical protein
MTDANSVPKLVKIENKTEIYGKLTAAFFDRMETENIAPVVFILYMHLLHMWRKAEGDTVIAKSSDLIKSVRASKRDFFPAIKSLADMELIAYKEGGNRFSAPEYTIIHSYYFQQEPVAVPYGTTTNESEPVAVPYGTTTNESEPVAVPYGTTTNESEPVAETTDTYISACACAIESVNTISINTEDGLEFKGREYEGNQLRTGESQDPQPVTPSITPAQSLEAKRKNCQKRVKEFGLSLVPYIEEYGKEMIRDFFDYWTEPNKSKTKVRWEMQEVFDIPKRLATWYRKTQSFAKPALTAPSAPAPVQSEASKFLKNVKSQHAA